VSRRQRRTLLGAAALAGVWPPLLCAQTAQPPDREHVQRGRTLQFPRDHGAHLGAAIEWWYLTGWLQADEQRRFGFQITFFRSRTGLAEGLDSRFAARQLLFAHAALSDLYARRHLHLQRIARWSGDDTQALARAALHDTDVRLGGWTLLRNEVEGRSRYAAAFGSQGGASAQDFWLDLELRATQSLLLQGDAGFSRKGPDEAQASHYLSEPQLDAQGTLTLAGQRRLVRGRAWLDHEWSDRLLHPQAVGWDWVGMNLDDGAALTVFQLRRADGSRLWAGGSHRTAQGAVQVFAADAVHFTPGRIWQSPASAARYPLAWQIDTPAGHFEVRALLDTQELDSRASTGTVYWEGLSELLDAQQRRIGLGYLEMTGYSGMLRLG
jgi:predicted secreted hydrolase